ncbi:hypothetical protein MACH24_29960 [Erythrobacter sp. Dej080120_24]|jgi:hypothetical protein|uniref:DUF6607 family protein n=1 Tax=Erythrobacter sp. Dej080120_24 TaxID=3024837 RepID=UPI0004DA276C|nr:hypothetical protein EH30_10885 [Erythrobacter sp. JL475]BDW83558.1 hypothetical protein MACH24_29960 [Erythrobacter sp. Dej080120_24]
MLKLTKTLLASGLAATALAALPAPALADDPITRSASAEEAAFQADRESILAMAGDFKVTFNMQESTAWMEGYEPIDSKISGGHESVRVIEDTGTRIVLQHLLVVGGEENPYVVKHWRQDWQYEPTEILTYQGGDTWEMTPVPEAMRAGRWSQTVYQVDDSPRYAGWGQWETTNGVKRWRSNWTTRPLARRDATRSPVYDRYVGINRHQLTPNGWIHWQDNTKMMPAPDGSGELVPVVQEYVLNTYERFDGYNVAAAEAYWAKTADYWNAVRAKWDEVAETTGGIRIAQEANYGTDVAAELLKLADAIKQGETPAEEATAKAVALIETGTARSGG